MLATWIFAFAPSHAVPLSWLANREVLVSLARVEMTPRQARELAMALVRAAEKAESR